LGVLDGAGRRVYRVISGFQVKSRSEHEAF
jgi:hypothetical protein